MWMCMGGVGVGATKTWIPTIVKIFSEARAGCGCVGGVGVGTTKTWIPTIVKIFSEARERCGCVRRWGQRLGFIQRLRRYSVRREKAMSVGGGGGRCGVMR